MSLFNFDYFDKAKAKGTTGGESVKLCRDIFQKPIVFNVGVSGDVFELLENDTESSTPIIYQGIPSNLGEYVLSYYRKFQKAPPIMFNIVDYDIPEGGAPMPQGLFQVEADTVVMPSNELTYTYLDESPWTGTKETLFYGLDCIINSSNSVEFTVFNKADGSDECHIKERDDAGQWGGDWITECFNVENKVFGAFESGTSESPFCTFEFIKSVSEENAYKGIRVTMSQEEPTKIKIAMDMTSKQVSAIELASTGNMIGLGEATETGILKAQNEIYVAISIESNGEMGGQIVCAAESRTVTITPPTSEEEEPTITESINSAVYSNTSVASDPSLNITQD